MSAFYCSCSVLICVSNLFDGDVDLVVEEDSNGDFVNASSHFEFMLRRKSKAVCIVQAKKDNFRTRYDRNLGGL
jgi:hypothetical protein